MFFPKHMFVSFLALICFYSNFSFSSISPQIINLTMQIKGKSSPVKSELTMPFYQTAELERRIDNRDYLIEFKPKIGKNVDEVEVLIKLYNKDKIKVLGKKEIVAKLNQESKVSLKGVTLKFTPQI